MDLSKNIMYQFWYDYVKSKYGKNAKLCYMDIESFMENPMTFTTILQKILKQDLTLQILKKTTSRQILVPGRPEDIPFERPQDVP